jgi:hypothetical protein
LLLVDRELTVAVDFPFPLLLLLVLFEEDFVEILDDFVETAVEVLDLLFPLLPEVEAVVLSLMRKSFILGFSILLHL